MKKRNPFNVLRETIPQIGQKESTLYLKYTLLLFEVCFFVHLTSSLVGWNRKIDDFHGFRQSQTAISTYYTIKDGFLLHYETPVLGKPWSMPMEFPLYQWLVAASVNIFHTPLDQTGRFWSLFFFYLSLFPIFFLLGFLVREKEKRLLILCFILMNPIYLFWSRTFMIESLALFLGLLYVWASAKALTSREHGISYLLFSSALGILAGVVKATTWVVYALPCTLLIFWSWFQNERPRGCWMSYLKYSFYGFLFLMVPFLGSLGWAQFADSIKSLNPMADGFLTSHSQNQIDWIFGNLSQRISPAVWGQILENLQFPSLPVLGNSFSSILIILVLMVFATASGRRIAKAVCMTCFMFPLLIFTNLYCVHDYYFYANGLFLSVFIGLILLNFLEAQKNMPVKILIYLLIPLILILSYGGYLSHYRIFQKPVTCTEPVSRIVRENSGGNDVILIYGFDFDPIIPYYSQRKALMDRWEMPLDSPRMKKAMKALDGDRIKGMLIHGERSEDFIQERLKYFHLSQTGYVFLDFIFFPADVEIQKQ